MDMYDSYKEAEGCRKVFFITGSAVVLTVALCLLLSGCKTAPTAVAAVHNNHHEKENTNVRDRRDSIHVKDSIVYRYRHDTVFVDRWHTEWRDRRKTDSVLVRDSIRVHDSIPYPVEVVREVPVKNGYTRFTSWFFWIAVAMVLLFAGWKVCERVPATKPYTALIKRAIKLLRL